MLINEIFQILIQIIFIFFIFSCTSYIYNNKNILKLNITFPLDKITINLLILINLFLLFSIFNINQSLIIMVYILIFLLSFINKEFRNNLFEMYLNNTFLIIFILMFILSIDIAHELNLAWDAKFVYYFKTLVFFQNEKFDTLRNFPAADYPHLGAYIWSFFWKYPWSEYEYMGRISYLFIYLISIYSLINCLDHKNYIKNIFLILVVFSTYNYSLFSGYQDNLIFSLLTLLASFYYRFINSSNFKQKINYLYIILSIINILFWIKAESFIYSLVIFALIYYLNFNFIKKQKSVLLIFSAILIFKIFVYYYYNLGSTETFKGVYGYSIDRILNLGIIGHLNNIKIVTYYIFFNIGRNPIFLISIFCIFIIFKNQSDNSILKFIILFIIFNIIFIYLSLVLKVEYVEYIGRNSIGRLLHQSSGFYLLSMIVYLNKIKISKKK